MSNEPLIFDGDQKDLPAFIPGFAIPVPRAWFDALFKKRKQKGKRKSSYVCDACGVATGYIVYDCEKAYTEESWPDALRTIGFAVQVEWAQSTTVAATARHGMMEVSILKPDRHRKALKKERRLETTQERFVMFLRSGNLEDLEASNEQDAA